MKRKRRKISNQNSKEETIPDWLGGEDLKDPPDMEELEEEPDEADVQPPVSKKPFSHVTSTWLDEVSAGTEENIRDTPAWKEAVRSLGLPEARRRLRLSCLASQIPEASAEN